MSNQNVTIDGTSMNVNLPNLSSQTQLQGITPNTIVDNSLIAKIFGRDNQVEAELAKIKNQITIIQAMTEGNAEIAIFIENTAKQFLLDKARIGGQFANIMSDIEKELAKQKLIKLSEVVVQHTQILQEIKERRLEQSLEDMLVQYANNDLKDRTSNISVLYDGQRYGNTNIIALK